MELPEGFLIGAASSAIQTEGSNTSTDMWASEWSSAPAWKVKSGDACNSWELWRTDIDLVADAGLTAYRFGIEWARIQPEPGYVAKGAVQHYRSMVEYCHERGITPIVTLYHFSLPQWFAERGGWLSDGANEAFTAYLEAIAPIIDAGVSTVVTINEPNTMGFVRSARNHAGWGKPGFEGVLPPADAPLSDALISAHDAARTQLRATFSDLNVGWSVAAQAGIAVEPGGQQYVDTFFEGIEKPFLEATKGDDFVAIQSYTRVRFGEKGFIPVTDADPRMMNGWEFYPPTLGIALHDAHRVVGPDLPILVTENGASVAEDERRIEYARGALQALGEALREGIDIRGYVYWSLLDDWEFGTYDSTFGLVAFDPDTFERKPKHSLAWLGETAKSRTIPD